MSVFHSSMTPYKYLDPTNVQGCIQHYLIPNLYNQVCNTYNFFMFAIDISRDNLLVFWNVWRWKVHFVIEFWWYCNVWFVCHFINYSIIYFSLFTIGHPPIAFRLMLNIIIAHLKWWFNTIFMYMSTIDLKTIWLESLLTFILVTNCNLLISVRYYHHPLVYHSLQSKLKNQLNGISSATYVTSLTQWNQQIMV